MACSSSWCQHGEYEVLKTVSCTSHGTCFRGLRGLFMQMFHNLLGDVLAPMNIMFNCLHIITSCFPVYFSRFFFVLLLYFALCSLLGDLFICFVDKICNPRNSYAVPFHTFRIIFLFFIRRLRTNRMHYLLSIYFSN